MALNMLKNPSLQLQSQILKFSISTPSPIQTLKYPTKKLSSFPASLHFSLQNEDVEEDHHHPIGDCLVFEQDAFDDPYLKNTRILHSHSNIKKKKKNELEIEAENLVPDKWRQVQAEINITKKQRRKIAQEMEFNSRVEKKKKGLLPVREINLEEYRAYKEAKLAQLKPLVLDNPSSYAVGKEEEENKKVELSQRVAPKNPRWTVYGKGFDDVVELFDSGNYEPGARKSEGKGKLFTKEEKALVNKKIPDVAAATSSKWLPLHTLAASGEFYLVDALLKHNVDINGVNVDGLTALHKAIICKKQAITSYLLRESANPFVRDSDGATVMHYAVQTASTPAIKLLLLYNVDINLQDNDGWTPLHIAVQARRTDLVKLLLIKGADRTLKNQDGLTPLDLCLYSGRDVRTFELIKLLKQFSQKPYALTTQHYGRKSARLKMVKV